MKRLLVEYLEKKKDPNLYRCESCKHYSNCNICSHCSSGSSWAFDTQYNEYDKNEFEDWKKSRT